MKAAVLGSGPTGLLAANELIDQGFDTTVYTDRVRQPPTGAFYFHDLPEGIRKQNQPSLIAHRYGGAAHIYTHKQWNIEYESSFQNSSLILSVTRTFAWWPTAALWRDLMKRVKVQIGAIHADFTFEAIFDTNDFVVITFPFKHIPHHYQTPVAKVPLQDWYDITDGSILIAPGELFYDGLGDDEHCEIVRVSTPPASFREGFCWIELTKTSLLAMRWANQVRYISDLHPYQQPVVEKHNLPEHVLLAGRFATGDPKYLTHHVMRDIRKRCGNGPD